MQDSRPSFRTYDDVRRFAALATPIWVFDVDRHAMWWANPDALSFWRADSLEDLLSRDFSSDSEAVRERLREVVRAGAAAGTIREAWTLYPRDAPVLAVLAVQPVRLENARDGVLIEVQRVIDDRPDPEVWRVMEATRATAMMVATYTLDGRLLAQNPAAAACYAPAGGSLGDAAAHLELRIADTQLARQILHKVAKDETLSWEVEVQTRYGLRTHLVSARRGRDPITGDYVAVIGEEDISELVMLRRMQTTHTRQLEGAIAEGSQRLRDSEERYALAVQTAAIWDWDVIRDRLFLSPSFIRDLGYDNEPFHDLLRRDGVEALIHPDDVATFRAVMAEHLAHPERQISCELRFLTREGTARWYHSQGNFVCDAEGQPVRAVGLLTDITQRKDLEASLMAAQRMEAIGQLTGGIAHDFNNLLTVIQGNVQLLQEMQSGDPQLTAEIVKAVQRGAALTRQLLAFARQQTLDPRRVALDTLMTTLRKTLFRALPESIEVRIDVTPGTWPIHADAGQLEAALLNIAINARDAMPDGGQLTLAARNRSFAAGDARAPAGPDLAPGDYVEISVRDTGPGMPPEVAAKAFEPFFTTKEVGRGSGLGLSMVLGFSRQSGGDACISGPPEGGACVTLYLPRSEAPAGPGAPEGAPRTGVDGGEPIHLLEDNAEVRETLARMLRSLGYRVSCSETVDEALAATAQAPRPRLYLADVVLPGGKSGVDFARAVRRRDPQARVVLMSGYSNAHLAQPSFGALAEAFLAKPIDKSRLSRTLRDALAPASITPPEPD